MDKLFTVGKSSPIQAYGSTMRGNATISHPKKCMTYNQETGAPLGVVGTDYQVMQPQECAELVEKVTGHVPEVMWDGSKMIMQAKMNSGLLLPGDDQVDTKFTIINSFDGTSALTGMGLSFRMFCANQLNMAFSQSRETGLRTSIRHKGDWDSKVVSFEKACANVARGQAIFSQQVDRLVKTDVNTRLINQFWQEAAAFALDLTGGDLSKAAEEATKDKIRVFVNACTETYNQERDLGCPDSMWLAANAVTKYVQHSVAKKGRKTDPEVRRVDNTVGKRSKQTSNIMKHALAFAG